MKHPNPKTPRRRLKIKTVNSKHTGMCSMNGETQSKKSRVFILIMTMTGTSQHF